LSRLLSGKRGLSTDTIERLADYLGLRITIKPKDKTRKER
jgi:plasmid maintenance system antidote protein VapI